MTETYQVNGYQFFVLRSLKR